MASGELGRRRCGDESVEAGRAATQLGCYDFALRFVRNRSVLDVGCGLGKGLAILRREAASVVGQEIDPRLAVADVIIKPVEEFESRSYDVVTCFDVIEHVDYPEPFLGHLTRIARRGCFLTTPNWTASRCRWPYHLREYRPSELHRLLARYGRVEFFKGTPRGQDVYRVNHYPLYVTLNELRSWGPTALAARCLNWLLPACCKIHSHHGAWVGIY